MKVSIIIVSQNDEEHIFYLFESLSRQDFKNFEVLMVDFCSTDQTLTKAKLFPVKAFRLESGEKNLPRAINLAAKLCQGEIIFCLGGDVAPKNTNFISSGLETFKNQKTALTFGPRIKKDEAPLVRLLNFKMRSEEIKNIYLDACAFRKKFWENNQFSENNETSIWEWSLGQIRLGHKIIFNPQMTVFVQEKTGLIKHFKEKTKISRLYQDFKAREKR